MDDRYLPATQQKRKRLAAQGEFASSHELNSTIVFLGLVALAAASASPALNWFKQFTRETWDPPASTVSDPAFLQNTLAQVAWQFTIALGVAFLLCLIISLGLNFLNTGKLFPGRRKSAGWAAAGQGLLRLVSFETFLGAVLGLLKVIALTLVVFFAIRSDLLKLFELPSSIPEEWFTYSTQLVFKASFAAAICLTGFGLLDYGWQRWKFEQKILMDPEELRDELREVQTDPQIAAQRRQIQQQSRTLNRQAASRF